MMHRHSTEGSRLLILLQILLLCFCLWWLITKIEWAEVWLECRKVSLLMLGAVFIQRYLPYAMLGCRLSVLFVPVVSPWNGFKASVLCVGSNNVLPARMGEFVKIAWLHDLTGQPFSHLFSGVFLERLMDVTALLFLTVSFALPVLNVGLVVGMAVLLISAWGVAYWLASHEETLAAILGMLPLPKKMDSFVRSFFDACRAAFTRKIFGRAVVFTVFVWTMNYLHISLLANGLMGLDLRWHELGLLCVWLFFSSALLLAPGGAGVMEFAVVFILTALGTDTVKAAGTAVFARLFYSLPAMLGALFVLVEGGRTKFSNLRQEMAQHNTM